MEAKTQRVYLVSAFAEPVVVRIVGRASFQNCAPLKEFFAQLAGQGKRQFVCDFAQCTGMDSTFLGVLVGAALALRKVAPPGELALARLSERNLELIRNLGLHRLVKLDVDESRLQFESADQALAGPAPVSEIESARLVLDAHQKLVEADEANAAKFQDVIAFLKNRVDQG